MPLVGAGFGIEHRHPAIAVAIGGKHFLGRDVDRNVGGRAEPVGGIAVVCLARLADLQDEFSLPGELEQLSFLPLPASQMKSSSSTKMPCSLSGQS